MNSQIFMFVLVSGILHAAWNIAAKSLKGHFPSLWLGQALAGVFAIPVALSFQDLNQVSMRALLCIVMTGLIQASYFFLLGQAYRIGDISVVYPVARGLGVAFTGIVGVVVLNENHSLLGILGIVAVALGTSTLALQRTSHIPKIVFLYAVLISITLVMSSLNDIVAVKILDPMFYICTMFLGSTLFSIPLLRRDDVQWLKLWQKSKWMILSIGLGSMTSYVIILYTFRIGSLSYVIASREIAIVIGALSGIILFKENHSLHKLLSLTTIIAGIVMIRFA